MLISDIWGAFKQGKELTNSKTWKDRTIAGSVTVAFLTSAVGVARGFGYDIQIDSATIEAAGFGIAAIVAAVNAVVHVVTSSKVGLPDKTESGVPEA